MRHPIDTSQAIIYVYVAYRHKQKLQVGLYSERPMSLLERRVELAVNVALLCAFLMVAALAAQRFWHARSANRLSEPRPGVIVPLAGVDWARSGRTVVLALSTSCHFCSESADFYKRLVPEAIGHGVPVIAVLPQQTAEGRSYLDSLGLHVQDVLQSPLTDIDTEAPPHDSNRERTGKNKRGVGGKAYA